MVVTLATNAHTLIPHQLRIAHLAGTGSRAENREHDIPFLIEHSPDFVSHLYYRVQVER